jgi:signal peptidase I
MSKGLAPSFFLAVLITALAAIAGAEEVSECCFRMGSVSMKPTLFAADNFAAIKYATASDLKRGDIVIFRVPRDESVTMIKRVVGLPTDQLQMIDGLLYINGQAVKREQIEDFIDIGGQVTRVKRWRESLPNGVTYETLDLYEGWYDNTPVYMVPPHHFFVMGDNRDDSTDSRVLSHVGHIPFRNIIGRAIRTSRTEEKPVHNHAVICLGLAPTTAA